MIVGRYRGYPNKRLAAEAAIGALVVKGGRRFLQKRLAPTLPELAASARCLYSDPRALLAGAPLKKGIFDKDRCAELESEHRELSRELEGRYETQRLVFPQKWAIEAGTSFLLYALVRAYAPEVVIEMGVANGHSSYYLIRAMQANGVGKLHSFDISRDVGSLLSDAERESWEVRMIDPRDSLRDLERQLAELPLAGLCFHDADHGYLAQYFEFSCLWSHLTETGVFVGDDIDGSFAMIDFCRARDIEPDVLVDGRKAIGVIPRSPSR